MDILVKVAPRIQWESLVWVRNVLAEGKTKLALYVNRHSLWYFSVLITRILTASQTWHWMRFLASVSSTTNLFNMLLVFDKSSCDSLSSAIEKCQAWVLISKSCCSNDGEKKSMEKRTKSQYAVPKAFRFHLKMLKYYVSKKVWWMSITLSLCMRPRTAFAPSVVLQEGHEYLKSLGNGRAYWCPSPTPHITHMAQSLRVFLRPSPWQFTIIISPECRLRSGKTWFQLQRKHSEFRPFPPH